jgi:deoxycytidine triphosphate deaminase
MSTTNAAVLAKPAIMEAQREGKILISPFDERQVGNCSYDVRLGEFYYPEQQGLSHSILNPYDPVSVKQMWGRAHQAVTDANGLPGIPPGTKFIRIPPGGCILAHTEEFIGSVDNTVTTMMQGRSTIGRSFIQVECAGWGDIGFAQRWTMEIKNQSQHRHAVLVCGRRIAQIVFMNTTGIEPGDHYYERGKYQTSNLKGLTHEELLETWDPEMMLPKAHLDWELQQPKELTS